MKKRKAVARSKVVLTLPDGLWSAEHVAQYLKVSLRTVYDLPGLVRTELPGSGRQRIVKWHPDDVRDWARQFRKVAS